MLPAARAAGLDPDRPSGPRAARLAALGPEGLPRRPPRPPPGPPTRAPHPHREGRDPRPDRGGASPACPSASTPSTATSSTAISGASVRLSGPGGGDASCSRLTDPRRRREPGGARRPGRPVPRGAGGEGARRAARLRPAAARGGRGPAGRFRAELGIGAAPLVMVLGRITAVKAPLLAVEVARRVLLARPEARFAFVGGGDLLAAARSRGRGAGARGPRALRGLQGGRGGGLRRRGPRAAHERERGHAGGADRGRGGRRAGGGDTRRGRAVRRRGRPHGPPKAFGGRGRPRARCSIFSPTPPGGYSSGGPRARRSSRSSPRSGSSPT